MNPFNKLPGLAQRQAPHGMEWRVWRRLPAVLLWGTLLPGLVALLRHAWVALGPPPADHGALMLGDFTLVALVLLHWTLVFTLGLGCFIVYVMKGPAYVADAYPLPERDSPLP